MKTRPSFFLLAVLLAFPLSSSAEPREKRSVTKTSRNDGNSRLPFTISCGANSWTVVGSSQSVATAINATTQQAAIRRRSMTIQALGTVTYSVCLSTTSLSGDTCDDNRAGYELGAAWGSVTVFDESLWYCRTRAGGSTQIKGVEFFDDRDEVK